jgi:hypothetical protein
VEFQFSYPDTILFAKESDWKLFLRRGILDPRDPIARAYRLVLKVLAQKDSNRLRTHIVSLVPFRYGSKKRDFGIIVGVFGCPSSSESSLRL